MMNPRCMESPQVQSLHQAAQAHLKAGRIPQAAEVLRQLVRDYPREPRAHFMLGVLAHQSGQFAAAFEHLSTSIEIDPAPAEPYFIRGLIYQQTQRPAEAAAEYRKCIARRPNDGKALNNLGRAVLDLGDVNEAKDILRRAVTVTPKNAGAWNNLAEATRSGGDLEGAITLYKKAVEQDPNCAEAHGNLGATLSRLGERAAGIASMKRALAINPRLFNVQCNLARAYSSGGPLDEASMHCRMALEMNPNSANALDLMANLQGLAGQLQQCMALRRRALELDPGDSGVHSNLLLSLLYLDDVTAEDVFAAHLQWAQKHAASPAPPRREVAVSDRPMRIGYVSPNFNAHSVAYFFEPLLKAHDRSVVESYCYANLRSGDATTQRLRALADGWREIAGKTDAEVISMIQQDRIDILVDLAGHTSDNRLPVFAQRPAPIQMTWLGYPASTGLQTIDYRIADPIADPPGQAEALHTEKLLRIPGGCWAYLAPASPPIGPFPVLTNGFVTFGSFNNLPKVTPRVLETWARILTEVPKSRLLLKASGLGSSLGRENVQRHLFRYGIEPDRVELLNWTPTTEAHLQLYNRVDIALDTFPYNGTTTTCEAMWMGVPVVTFAGSSHVSRVGAALLTHAGCSQWIAEDVEGYTKLAVRLAAELDNMADVRRGLRERLAGSELCDARRLARELEKVYLGAARTER